MHFTSEVKHGPRFGWEFTQDEVKNEPMFFSADVDYAWEHGSSITRQFLAALPQDWREGSVFDSRVHMLMEGWYPCIPGFHHDDVPRSGPHGQPNYETPEYKAQHCMALVNGDICPTVFALGMCDLPTNVGAQPIYRRWHLLVEDLLQRGEMRTMLCPDRQLLFFDCDTLHSGRRALSPGWRWFGRISRNTHRQVKNETRHQVQVYLDNATEGW